MLISNVLLPWGRLIHITGVGVSDLQCCLPQRVSFLDVPEEGYFQCSDAFLLALFGKGIVWQIQMSQGCKCKLVPSRFSPSASRGPFVNKTREAGHFLGSSRFATSKFRIPLINKIKSNYHLLEMRARDIGFKVDTSYNYPKSSRSPSAAVTFVHSSWST